MALEKNLAQCDLSKHKQDPYFLLVKQLVRYSKFKTVVALKIINRLGFPEGSVKTWFDKTCQYLATGRMPSGATKRLINMIDDIVNASAVVIEEPSLDDARRIVKRTQAKIQPVISSGVRFLQTLNEQIRQSTREDVVWSYRQANGRLGKTFNTKEEVTAYCEALIDYNICKEMSLVKLSIEESF